MNINTDPMDNITSPEEYFAILAKENDLTPKEVIKKRRFEWFITNCEKNPDLLSDATEDVYAKYKNYMITLSEKENKTPLEQEAVNGYQQKILEMGKEENEEEEAYKRTLSNKSGYVNATIILVMILNIGFIIAMALLGNK